MIYNIFSRVRGVINKINYIYSQLYDNKFEERKLWMEDKIVNSHERGISDDKIFDYEVVVSLTTYGKRLFDVSFTIESLMQQTRKPNRIILWLGNELKTTKLPSSLELQKKRGLEIRFTEDIKSYKKLIPALVSFPEAVIITVDDDVIYDYDIIDRMISSYMKTPDRIHACRVHKMVFNKKGTLDPYNTWEMCSCDSRNPPVLNFLTGVGGVLYPPHCLDMDVLNKEVFLSICPTADDVWFTAMALRNGTFINKIETRNIKGEDYVENTNVQDVALSKINTGDNGKNDSQIRAVFEKYRIFDIIKNHIHQI